MEWTNSLRDTNYQSSFMKKYTVCTVLYQTLRRPQGDTTSHPLGWGKAKRPKTSKVRTGEDRSGRCAHPTQRMPLNSWHFWTPRDWNNHRDRSCQVTITKTLHRQTKTHSQSLNDCSFKTGRHSNFILYTETNTENQAKLGDRGIYFEQKNKTKFQKKILIKWR